VVENRRVSSVEKAWHAAHPDVQLR